MNLMITPLAATEAAGFELGLWDYAAFIGYFVILSAVGLWAGRRKKDHSDEYFLAGRTLPWYVVGCSFIASNISAEHFIGMIGAAFVFGICAAMFEWGNVLTFSILVWIFIPFLLSSRVFTTPEFMERRFNNTCRQFFAIVTVLTNVVAFLAAVLYGGGLALQRMFEWNLWTGILAVGIVAGGWAIYGGLRTVAWMDLFTVIVMITGGLLVTALGLMALAPDGSSLLEGARVMLERNRAAEGVYKELVERVAPALAGRDTYNRLSVIQPITHTLVPWLGLVFIVFSVSIWYNVINQFMIQRVLGARNMYHARMGIVLAGYLKIILPAIVVVPGLILFAYDPSPMGLPFAEIATEADKGYVTMLQMLIPIGLRGVFLAALFGAIQSTIQAVINSTSTVFTMDIYKRMLVPDAPERHLVRVGRLSAVIFLLLAVGLARLIAELQQGLFEYIQTLYAFFAPPFGAVFLLGILWRRINAAGATATLFAGFGLSLAIKLYLWQNPDQLPWLEPFMMQATVSWLFSMGVCIAVSLATAPPPPQQVTDELTINWRTINLWGGLGAHWYTNVVLWWGLFVALVVALMILFSGAVW